MHIYKRTEQDKDKEKPGTRSNEYETVRKLVLDRDKQTKKNNFEGIIYKCLK